MLNKNNIVIVAALIFVLSMSACSSDSDSDEESKAKAKSSTESSAQAKGSSKSTTSSGASSSSDEISKEELKEKLGTALTNAFEGFVSEAGSRAYSGCVVDETFNTISEATKKIYMEIENSEDLEASDDLISEKDFDILTEAGTKCEYILEDETILQQ